MALTREQPLDPDKNVPDGWSDNPSAWAHRLPIVGAAAAGCGIAIYLALYQWRVISHVWEPFFTDPTGRYASGGERVLNSWLSRTLPVPDAFLGALGYFADVVASLIGGVSRWRTMPWIVLMLGVLVGSMGLAAVALVVIQPLVLHAWCSLCLASAGISLLIVPLTASEFLASLRHLRRQHRRGQSVWRAFWGFNLPPPREARNGDHVRAHPERATRLPMGD
jgi:uncharacterized membrane protein